MIGVSQPIETSALVTEHKISFHMKNNPHLHVFLADDDIDTLSALRLLLSQQNGVIVVGQAVQLRN